MLVTLGHGPSPCQTLFTSPKQFPNLKLWLDAQDFSSLTFSSGSGNDDPVSIWGDKSGNNYHCVTTSPGSAEMIYKSIGILGKPALRMDTPQAGFKNLTNTLYDSTGTVIVFCAALPERTQATGNIFDLVNGHAVVELLADGRIYYDDDEGFINIISDEDLLDDINMIALTFESTSLAHFYLNGKKKTFNPEDRYDDNGFFRLGYDTLAPQPECEFYGALIYDTPLSDLNLNKIYNWGKRLYGRVSTRYMYMIIGQSNAEGHRTLADTGVPDAYNNNSRIDMLNTDKVLRKASDPVDINTGAYSALFDNSGVGFGASMPFAQDITSEEAIAVGLVPVAKGGKAIAWWDRGDPDDTTTAYGATLAQAKEAQKNGILKAVIMYQGESDAVNGTSQATYESKLTTLIANLRTDLELPSLPFIITKLHQWDSGIETQIGAAQAEWEIIQAAQEAVAGSIADVYIANASDLTGEPGDAAHLTVSGYKTVGLRWSQIAKSLI